MLFHILLAVADRGLEDRLSLQLCSPDVSLERSTDQSQLWKSLSQQSHDLFILDRQLISRTSSSLVETLANLPDRPWVVVLTDREDAEERAKLITAGCEAVLTLELPDEFLAGALNAIIERRRDYAKKALSARQVFKTAQLEDFVYKSPSMQAFIGNVRRIVNSNTSLLILGETGVGKERLARAIHSEGPRSEMPFITVNCAALPETLLESELFGHDKGAFTGAFRSRRGCFELAHGGTLFLDEICELHSHLQVKLLRALQEREVQRLGGEHPIKVDVRIMAATNRDIDQEVAHNRFRSDLYYRLNVISLTIPPLRERHEDIPDLVTNYIHYLRPITGREVYHITGGAMEALIAYDWPGNVRELINIVERAMLLCHGDTISGESLPGSLLGRVSPCPPQDSGAGALDGQLPPYWLKVPLKAYLGTMERQYLAALLRETGGLISETAERAGLQTRTLYNKMKEYGLNKEDFRGD